MEKKTLATEKSPLLPKKEKHHAFGTAAPVAPGRRGEHCLPKVNSRGNDYPDTSVVVLLSFITVTLLIVLIYTGNPAWDRPNLISSDFVLAPDVVAATMHHNRHHNNITNTAAPLTTNLTFRQLAQSMMPEWYESMILELDIFTPTVQPGDVYRVRKILLKTRDLWDVFSLTYPNQTTRVVSKATPSRSSSNNNADNSYSHAVDFWYLIRRQLNAGYTVVGEFQDLENSHIRYKSKDMQKRRKKVLQWKQDFLNFRQTYNDTVTVAFLRHPENGCYEHVHSHLFWDDTGSLPRGSDLATDCLHILGVRQAQRAVMYLRRIVQYKTILDEEAHDDYHNLRKQLRSLTDEFDVFQWTMFPMTAAAYHAVDTLFTARKLLGDMNDDWTAHSFYTKHNEHHRQQERLAKQIQERWDNFKVWLVDSDLLGNLEALIEMMKGSSQSDIESSRLIPSVNQFLKIRKRQPTRHFVIGNEAGDADTIVSAITLAYVESFANVKILKTPLVSITKADFATQRPEVKLLLNLANITNPTKWLFFLDDQVVQKTSASMSADVTLVDHNVVENSLMEKNWSVVEIVDHHVDKGLYLETCTGNNRTIAFADEKALVASTCTLVAERTKSTLSPPYPASLSLLLLGVILLDSVNLSNEVGKVTERDRDAVQDLLQNTNWNSLPRATLKALNVATSSTETSLPDTNALFVLLQNAKYDVDFWESLPVQDALRYDYKDFVPFTATNTSFGIATILMDSKVFFAKDVVLTCVANFMSDIQISFLAIMFAFQDHNDEASIVRQLALFAASPTFPMDDLVSSLLTDPNASILELHERNDISKLIPQKSKTDPTVVLFDQQNVKPSRKQIGPILAHYFEAQQDQPTRDKA